MGAWGHQPFENDSALDWVADFEVQENKLLFLERTFQQAIEMSEDYLEVDEGSAVVTAAEILAAMKGHGHPELPDDLASLVSQQSTSPSSQLSELAIKSLKVIQNPEHSEIAALWEESEENGWLESVADLEARLQS